MKNKLIILVITIIAFILVLVAMASLHTLFLSLQQPTDWKPQMGQTK